MNTNITDREELTIKIADPEEREITESAYFNATNTLNTPLDSLTLGDRIFVDANNNGTYEIHHLSRGEGAAGEVAAVRLPRPAQQEARLPRPVDPAHQRRGARARPDL